jgi:NADH-quinone oxidoreductase subunit L
LPVMWLTIAGGAFFFGAIAKSAQFPLHTWLPDAMEGPTSISALIHAATMVAAGVFLIMRVYPLFNQDILMIIVAIGVSTAFMAATISLVQNDIKKILAYSTISQLGFMMLAMGMGALDAGIFHLATHAFFKCLLFLGAGSLIYELQYLKQKEQLDFDYQDIRNMGGMRFLMPLTFITMLIASLALAGVPFTSGYLSKDIILIRSFEWASSKQGLNDLVPYFAVLTSWITTFYIARLMFKVFFGEFRFGKKMNGNVSTREVPLLMKIALIVLALCCLFPIFSYNPLFVESSWIMKGFPVEISENMNSFHIVIPIIVTTVSIALIYFAFIIYVKRDKLRTHVSGHNLLYQFVYQQWYLDKIYDAVFIKPLIYLSRISYGFDRTVINGIVNIIARVGIVSATLTAFFDRYVVDALINALASISKSIGNFTRHLQTGRLQQYMITMLIVVLTFFILKYFSQAI